MYCTPYLCLCRSANISVLLDITVPGKTTEVHPMGISGACFISNLDRLSMTFILRPLTPRLHPERHSVS